MIIYCLAYTQLLKCIQVMYENVTLCKKNVMKRRAWHANRITVIFVFDRADIFSYITETTYTSL